MVPPPPPKEKLGRVTLKGILSMFDSDKIFASDWLWIEVYQKVVLTKIDITMKTINKKIGNW